MDARQHIIHEAIEEQRQIFGMENPDKQWILSSWDTWEKNPFYQGEEQQHPEDDATHEEWLENQAFVKSLRESKAEFTKFVDESDDDCPF